MSMLAVDLVNREVSVIVALGRAVAANAAKAATATVPIVFAIADDPVRHGLVESLGRPGGNATGVSYFSGVLGPKRLGLLLELVPDAEQVDVLINPSNPPSEIFARQIGEAAAAIGVREASSL